MIDFCKNTLRIIFLRLVFFIGLAGNSSIAFSQQFELTIHPVYSNESLTLEKTLLHPDGDSLTINTLKFYLGNFKFYKNGQLAYAAETYHLLNLEDENSLQLSFDFPEKTTFDSLHFDLGTDSLTNCSGAMGGDLDPTKGMFWTWQSGYIHVKLEGVSSKCTNRNQEFQFHLGGYLPPFQSVQRVALPYGSTTWNAQLDFDLSSFFQKINWLKNPDIMSPNAEAVRLMALLSKSFSWHDQ